MLAEGAVVGNNTSNNKTVASQSKADSTTPSSSLNQLLNQELNISNYMDYSQNLSYDDSGLQSSINLEPLTVNGKVVQIYDTKNGVEAEAFVTTGAGAKQIVIGYAGTGIDQNTATSSLFSSPTSATGTAGDLFSGAQFYDDVAILAGQSPTGAVASATSFAKQVVRDAAKLQIGKSDVYLTGHTLGGTLAEYVAAGTGLGGTTFGAAGISTKGSANATNFTNIVDYGDPIGNYVSNGPLGSLVLSTDIKHYGTEELVGSMNQQQLSTDAAGIYSALTQPQSQNSSNAESSALSLVNDLITYDSLPATYAADLGSAINVTDFGSYAYPTLSSGLQTPPPTQVPTSGPAASLTTSIATRPSTQVVEQDINICNYLYSSKTIVSFADSRLGELGLKPLTVNGKVVQLYNQKAGVSAEAFETTGSGPKRVIIAYEGTNPYGDGNTDAFSGSQLLDDASFFAAKPAAGAAVADKFAKEVIGIAVSRGIAKFNVSLTGHSLGAAEAEYAAEATGLAGVTFGTPGIDITGKQAPSKLTNFVDDGDPVGNFGADGADPLGNFVTSSNIQHYGGVTLIGDNYSDPTGKSGLDPVDAQANLVSTSEDFFNSSDTGDYKNLVTAVAGFLGDFKYHHLSSYAAVLDSAGYTGISLVCYCTGTAIRTPCGDRAVEALRPGDLVVTASGETRPIKWIGHRLVDCRKHPRPGDVWPVRITAHAFGENRPARDLLVSPAHAICIDVVGEMLIPAGALVDGRTVSRQKVDRVTYWHVELETHDILLAENLPAESYLDMGNRGFFENAEVVDLAAGPDAPAPSHADFCRPYVAAGPILDAVRARLDVRADPSPRAGEARAA